MTAPWTMSRGRSPIVAVALHAGHDLPPGIARLMALDERDRLRMEEPFTDGWTRLASSRVVVHLSRFAVDLDQPRERAVYLDPRDAWGLEVWRSLPPRRTYEASLELHDLFYEQLGQLLDELVAVHGRLVVLDLHSYCHRRAGPDRPPEAPLLNPDVNVGTWGLDRAAWGGLLDRFVDDLQAFEVSGQRLDVREDIRSRGGHLARWIHETYGEAVCALPVDVKKTFMDEWTGKLDYYRHRQIGEALGSTIPGLVRGLSRGAAGPSATPSRAPRPAPRAE